MVPKCLYMTEEDLERDRSPEEAPFGAGSLYHTAHVMKDFPHEVTSAYINVHCTIITMCTIGISVSFKAY